MNSMHGQRRALTGGRINRTLLAVGICKPAAPGLPCIGTGASQPSPIFATPIRRQQRCTRAVTSSRISSQAPRRLEDYLCNVDGSRYAGFNLLVSDSESLSWLSNRGDGVRNLAPGLYGLSNALLDSPWHKVVRAKHAFGKLLDEDRLNETELLRLLDDKQRAPASQIDSDRLPFESAHAISAPFIVLPDYGTRSSSVVLLDQSRQLAVPRTALRCRWQGSGRLTIHI